MKPVSKSLVYLAVVVSFLIFLRTSGAKLLAGYSPASEITVRMFHLSAALR